MWQFGALWLVSRSLEAAASWHLVCNAGAWTGAGPPPRGGAAQEVAEPPPMGPSLPEEVALGEGVELKRRIWSEF